MIGVVQQVMAYKACLNKRILNQDIGCNSGRLEPAKGDVATLKVDCLVEKAFAGLPEQHT